jgi:hypothetical protein
MTVAGGVAKDTPVVVRESLRWNAGGRGESPFNSVFLRAMIGLVRIGTELVGVGARRACGDVMKELPPERGDWLMKEPCGEGGVGGRTVPGPPRGEGGMSTPRDAGEGEGEGFALPGLTLRLGGREMDATDM